MTITLCGKMMPLMYLCLQICIMHTHCRSYCLGPKRHMYVFKYFYCAARIDHDWLQKACDSLLCGKFTQNTRSELIILIRISCVVYCMNVCWGLMRSVYTCGHQLSGALKCVIWSLDGHCGTCGSFSSHTTTRYMSVHMYVFVVVLWCCK